MGNPSDQQRIKSLIREGLRQLRTGSVSAALTSWEDALTLDEGHTAARSYIDYIQKNRIRIAVHLGRTPTAAHEPIQIPDGWPEPPAGLCDAVAEDDEKVDANPGAAPVQPRRAAKSSGHLPYAEMELTGASRPRLSDVLAKGKKKSPSPATPRNAPPAPRPLAQTTPNTEEPRHRTPTRSPTGDDYLTMEIVVEDDEPPADPSQAPRVATTFDEVATTPRSDPEPFSRHSPGSVREPSPYTTLAGLGPRVLFAEPGDKDQQGKAPPLDFAPSVGEDPAPGGPSSQTPEDYREKGPFSDDLPTRARPSTVQAGTGVIAEPRDFTREGYFSDDIPTTARPDRGGSKAGFRAMPPNQDFRREGSFSDDQATGERSGERSGERKDERLSEDMEALLHPNRGLALAKQLFGTGENERSLQLTELLLERYPTLTGLSDLLEANRNGLEASLLAELGDLEAIPVPKTADLGQDNQDLDPRAAFLFSRIDGTMSLQDIIDISGMSQFESVRLLLRLRDIGLLDFEPPR